MNLSGNIAFFVNHVYILSLEMMCSKVYHIGIVTVYIIQQGIVMCYSL